MKKLMLTLAICLGFSAVALPVCAADKPDNQPARPGEEGFVEGGGEEHGEHGEGEEHGEGGEEHGEGGGQTEETIGLTGAWTYDCETNTIYGQTLESTTTNQNVILAKNCAYLTVSNCTLYKSGDSTNENSCNFFALNAVVAAKTNAMVCIENCKLYSNADGANCLFASGEGSTIYAYDCTLKSTKSSSRGLDATYGGTVIASKMTIDTSSDHCAALATDRGNGYISATESSLTTAGQGSALIYSTGVIEANGVTGTASGAQIAGIEGLSTIRIRNSDLSGSAKKASEPEANGVIIYQSMSGDSTEGTATFEVSDSTLTSAITNGAMFYITNSKGVITVRNTDFDYDSTNACLIIAAGNDGEHGWGSVGSNGAEVVFTAIDQKLAGNVSVDGISSLDMYLTNSTYTGTFINDATYTGNGDGIDLFVSGDSTWTVTANCKLKSLTAAPGAKIVDGNGNAVPIVTEAETKVVGTSSFKITVSDYTEGTFPTTNITDFAIGRSAFERMYSGKKGGGQSVGSGTYYFKPHAPTNGVVGVSFNGTKIYPDTDHKYWLDNYWTNGVTVTVDFSSSTKDGYFFADGSSVTSLVVTITENKINIYPPAGYETAYLAHAKSGATYYRTLREAIDAAGSRAKICLCDNVTLEETLTVTNAITLDLNTNTVTTGTTLTEAFRFTAGGTVSNGTIKSSLAANVEDAVLLRFTGSKAKATLSDVKIAGDGCLLCVDDGAAVTVTNGCSFTCNSAATVYCSSNGTLSVAGDTYKGDGVVMAAPDGCLWEDGSLVSGTLSESFTAGETSDPYDDAQSATNAAATINANKADAIVVPSEVEGSAKAVYLMKVEATVTDGNCVVVDLTSEARSNEQAVVDAAVTNEAVFASLVSTNASEKVALSATTPGLYYWISGGTDAGAVTNDGAAVLSTDGGAVELAKPTLDATKGKAFFRMAAGVQSPAQ